jgi:hypothetical protein
MENGIWKLESSTWKLDGLDADGDWIGKPLVAIPYRVIQDSETVSAVKIKTVSVISNNFFQIFLINIGQASSPDSDRIRKTLLDKGFKLRYRGLKGLFFFSVEPPFGSSFFHQGVDIVHPCEVPDPPVDFAHVVLLIFP